MVFKLLWWKKKGAEKQKRRVEKPKRRVEKLKGRAEIPRKRVAKDDASHIIPVRSSSHRSTQSWKSVLDQMNEESDFHAKDWIVGSDFSPRRYDLSNPDLILRSRTVDSVEFAKRMARSKALDDTLENSIEYQKPSFVVPIDDRDDISIDDDTQPAVAETKFSGFLQMVQRILGDEPMPSPSSAVSIEDGVRNEPVKDDFIPLRYVICYGEEDVSCNNKEASTVNNASTSLPSSDQNVKNIVVKAFDDNSSTHSGSTSTGTGIITYDGSYDDNDPKILEAFDDATESFLKLIKVVKKDLWII